jgi:predicted Ser/Thr protein kinase
MTLSTGDRLGRYEILGILGAGGMGEVYRALDTELDREVAVKVLAEAVAGNPERIARFEREARVLASLSHQNIATLYGLEEHDGQRFLVMELALGETLDEHLQKKNVPVDEALEIALEIAAGLEAAHELGVVHRDLKPANVMLSPEGRVKVLDFGLAKAWQADEGDPDITQSPTVTGQMTEAGVLLGTVSYMSPEQARGRRVDNRTDIWAFGCLLFEMLSGEKPFQGETITDTLAAVVTHEPEWDRLHDATPPAVRRLLRRCLQKAPGRRLHAIADARIEIEDAVSEPARAYHSSPVTDAGSRSGATAPRAAALALAGAIVGGALAAGAVWYASRTDEAAAPRGPLPVVFLMDTLAPYGVYDAETRNNAGTNADDLNGLLRDLPIEIHKETLGSRWDREDQILKQRPDLIVVHRSAFYHSINLELGYGYPPFDDPVIEARAYRVYEIVLGKLIAFFGYVGMGDPHTKFLVYSRGAPPGWIEEQQRAFVAEAERRYPHLKGRVFTFQVPRNAAGESSFRDPTTGEAIRKRIVVLLELEDRGPEPR